MSGEAKTMQTALAASNVQTGAPTHEGRYVVFRQCESTQAREWVEPEVMTWHGKKWHLALYSEKHMNDRPVLGWIGPIPVVKVVDLPTEEKRGLDWAENNLYEGEARGEETQFPDEPAYDL